MNYDIAAQNPNKKRRVKSNGPIQPRSKYATNRINTITPQNKDNFKRSVGYPAQCLLYSFLNSLKMYVSFAINSFIFKLKHFKVLLRTNCFEHFKVLLRTDEFTVFIKTWRSYFKVAYPQRLAAVSKLKHIQTSFSNFMWDSISYVYHIPIPPTPSVIFSKIAKKYLYLSVEMIRVIAQTLLGFYRYSNLEGTWNEQSSNASNQVQHPLRFYKELLWRV